MKINNQQDVFGCCLPVPTTCTRIVVYFFLFPSFILAGVGAVAVVAAVSDAMTRTVRRMFGKIFIHKIRVICCWEMSTGYFAQPVTLFLYVCYTHRTHTKHNHQNKTIRQRALHVCWCFLPYIFDCWNRYYLNTLSGFMCII